MAVRAGGQRPAVGGEAERCYQTGHTTIEQEVAKYTGLSRNGVYRACKRALARLRELGATYRKNGQLGERIKQAIRSRPQAAVQRSLSARLEKTMRSRWEISRP